MALIRCLAIIWLFCCVKISSSFSIEYDHNRDEGDTSLGRLPLTFSPINYTLELQPDVYTGSPPFFFSGSVQIRVECTQASSILYLNNNGLGVVDGSVAISLAPDSPIQAPQPVWVKWELDPVFQFFKLFLDEDLVVGAHYVVELGFTGTMNEPSQGVGLYYESYESLIDGETKYLATTLMWASSAREVFPCFDEPQLKATFEVTLLRRDGVVALANADSVGVDDRGDGWFAETFAPTVKLSTYTLCFVIGDFGYKESFTSSGTKVRVWAVPHYVQDLEWANTVAADIQEAHEDWTGLRDPLSKMDHIVIPGFAGAMENWGLVTYSESTMLYNATYSTLADERRVATVIAHELAHMWFGNLVTLRWWNDAWLNEGFATYFENVPLDTVLGWDQDTLQIQDSIRTIMSRDSSAASIPVRIEVDTPMESTSGYSTYAYNKGGAVLRMLRQILGEATFQNGLRRYLQEFSYSNAQTDDLWDILTQQADEDGVLDTDGLKLYVKEKLDPWVDQRGYPLVTLTRAGPGLCDVTQTQFLSPRDQEAPPSPYLYQWYVPLTISNQAQSDWNTDTKEWLNRDNKSISVGIPGSVDDWFVANIDQLGFYRVQYDNTTYYQIVNQLDTDASVIPKLTRYSILNDIFEITRAGYGQEVVAMEATRFLNQDNTYLIWDTAERALSYPSLVLTRYPDAFTALQTYLRSKLDPVYNTLGWANNPEDGNERRSARSVVLSLTCAFLNQDCATESRQRFDEYQASAPQNNIFVDHRPTVYCTSIRDGSADDWGFLHSQYVNIADVIRRSAAPERGRILESLACSEDDIVLQRYINYTFDTSAIRSRDASSAIDALANADRGRWVLFYHLKQNWNNSPLPSGISKINTLQTIVEGFATAEDILELEDFIALNPPNGGSETSGYDNARATVNNNKAWADENEAGLRQWFTTNSQ